MTIPASLRSFGPVPSPRQVRHHFREFYGFVHFTINTFTDKEWGFGDESPALFDPSDFDAIQIARVAADAGMTGLILTCKHHDGFCLWPTATTTHSVKSSPFRDGKGDVVREIADACRAASIEFGIYLSPWDRNSALYGTPDYVTDIYRPQLRELLTNYGPLFEVWFDGANGGDGWYGGARETRKIDPANYYGWEETWQIVRDLQPGAVMFSDCGPDVRWIGNEDGIAGDPCWATLEIGNTVPGVADREQLNRGDRGGGTWLIPECDVSIRPGWFWHQSENDRVRSGKNLRDLYFQSVGRGATFLLNLTPDRRGQIPTQDIKSLEAFRRHREMTFGRDLTDGATFAPPAQEGLQTAKTITLTLPAPAEVNVIRLREDLLYGQRVDSWELLAWQDDEWKAVAAAEAIGAQRIVRFAATMTDRYRLRIVASQVDQLAISEIAFFFEPEMDEPASAGIAPPARLQNFSVTQVDAGTLIFDLGTDAPEVSGLNYTPNIAEGQIVDQYIVSDSKDGLTWREVARGEFANIRSNSIPQILRLPDLLTACFVRFQAVRFALGDRLSPENIELITDDAT